MTTPLFVPRATFGVPASIPKTYFSGHHAAGLNKIRGILSTISLVLECRDFRLPLSTHNPVLEQLVAGRERIVVYTKADLGADSDPSARRALRRLYGDAAFFWDKSRPATTASLLSRLRGSAERQDSLTGMRAIVVGMPNVGKSTLLNALRTAGAAAAAAARGDGSAPRVAKAAKTGDQAGVTRKVGTSVRVVGPEDQGGVAGGVYILDTPGIFQPYVEDGEAMLKVALAHGIKKGLIPDEILVDYLLFRLNQWDPTLYARYCPPTNDVAAFLEAVARRDGKLKPRGLPNLPEAAARVLSQWRDGKLGRYVLDGLSETDVAAHQRLLLEPQISKSQAIKAVKEERKKKNLRSGNT